MSWIFIWSWYLSSNNKLSGFSLISILDKFIYWVWLPSIFIILSSGIFNLFKEFILVILLLIKKRSLNFGASKNTVNSTLLIYVWLMRIDWRLMKECITTYRARLVLICREGFYFSPSVLLPSLDSKWFPWFCEAMVDIIRC